MEQGSGTGPGLDPRSPGSAPGASPGPTPVASVDDSSMMVLASGILLLGGIAVFIGWGLTHAYPAG